MAIKKVITVEIGLYFTKVCEVDYLRKSIKTHRMFMFETPENTIEDGYIRDKNSFTDSLRYQLKEHKFKNKNIVFTVASSKIMSREVQIPMVKEARVADIVRAQANDYFPMDISEHILTHTVLSEVPETKQMNIMVYAAPATLVKNYYSVAEMLGMNLIALDFIGNAAFQALKRIQTDDLKFVVQINQQSTLVTILQKKELLMQRNINFGLVNLIEAVHSCRAYADKTPQECFALLCDNKLLRGSFEERGEGEDQITNEVSNELMDEMRLLVGNINRMIEYFNTKEQNDRKIDKIYVTDLGVRVKGIVELLKHESDFPVKQIETLQGVNFKKLMPEQQKKSSELVYAVGSAIKPVNFVPEDMIIQTKKKVDFRLYVLFGVLAILGAGTLVYYGYLDMQDAEKKNADLKTQKANLEYVNEEYTAFLESSSAADEAALMALNSYSNNYYLNDLIMKLEKYLPSNSIIEGINLSATGLNLSVVVDSKETAAQFLVQLKKIPYIGSTNITGIFENKAGDSDVVTVTFNVSLTWNDEYIAQRVAGLEDEDGEFEPIEDAEILNPYKSADTEESENMEGGSINE